MTHPEEHLAGYVDASLSPHERKAVDAHLADCARCRREVALATGARAALGSLAEIHAPPGVAASALREAALAKQVRSTNGPAWYRIAGIAAAAAAGLLVVALVLPKVGGSSNDATDRQALAAGGADSGGIAEAAAALVIQDVDYDAASLSALASSFKAAEAGGGVETAEAPAAQSLPATPRQTRKALRCIVKSAPDETGQLTQLIEARFQGTPAYLAVFLEGPGADQPPDAVSVWVFATDGCAILSYSNARL
jgi:anti-sigma factor RsiW